MLKKSLIALAIASVAGSVSAAEIKVGNATDAKLGYTVSTEGRAIADQIAVEKIAITLEAEYTQNDIITLTFDGVSTIKDFQFLNSLTLQPKIYTQEDGTDVNLKGITLGKLSQTGNSVTYRVTAIDDSFASGAVEETGTQTAGIVLNITAQGGTPILFDAKSFTGSVATVTYEAKTNNGDALDTGNHKTRNLFTAKQELKASIKDNDKLDGVVDVDALRLAFEGSEVLDTVTFTLEKEAAEKLTISEDLETQTFQLNGDFAFLDTKPEEEGITPKAGAVAVQSGLVTDSLKVEADKITFKSTNKTPTLTIDVSGKKATEADAPIATQVFTAEVRTDYSVDGKNAKDYVVGTNLAAGQWTLNGAVVHVPYMPFRAGFSPIVNISNTSQQDGAIEVVVYAKNDNEWVKPQSYTLDITAKAQAQTDITADLRAQGIEGDVAFDIIVNAPKNAIEVNALYFQGGDRAVINTVKKD